MRTRRTAKVIWAALVAMPFLFAAVAFARVRAPNAELAGAVFWLAVVASAANVVLSRLLPPRLGPPTARARDAVAFSRALVAFALCDAAALAPLVAFIVTRDARLLVLVAQGVLALVLLFPTESRWRQLQPARIPVETPRPRGVR